MKKLFAFAVMIAFTFTLIACFPTSDRGPIEITIPDELPDENINVLMLSGFGTGSLNTQATDYLITEFNKIYPNVTIEHIAQGSYPNLRSAVIDYVRIGETPTLIMGYPDNFAEYLDSNSIIPLDEYINHAVHGVNLDDFVPSYIDENSQFGDIYSLPYAKSTEVVVYNKTKLDALGITFDENEILTWDYLKDVLNPIVVGSGTNQCDYVITVGSSGNAFINFTHQFDVPYTSPDGSILLGGENADDTLDMLTYIKSLFDTNTVVAPEPDHGDSYGSTRFKQGYSCMIQSSSAGVSYNLDPSFEYGILPAIQKNATPEEGSMSVMQQGPNIAIGADTSDAERLAAWLFIKFVTNTENSAEFARRANYLPVRNSSYDTTIWTNYLQTTNPDFVPFAQAAKVALSQQDWFNFDNAFYGRFSSTRARTAVGDAFEYLWNNSPQATMSFLREELGID